MEGTGSHHNSVAVTSRRNEKNKSISYDDGMEWEVVTEVPRTKPLQRKMTSLQQDLENFEVTKKKNAKKVANKEEKYFGLIWDLASTCE